MNEITVRDAQYTSRETVTEGATAFRSQNGLRAMIQNWAELKTISDSDYGTLTVLDSEYQVTGFMDCETKQTILGRREIRFQHSLSFDNDVNISSKNRDGQVNVRIRANGACEGEAPWGEIKINGREESMRRLAESILATLDGEDA